MMVVGPDAKTDGHGGSSPPRDWQVHEKLTAGSKVRGETYGLLVQLVERLLCTQEVKGSSPLLSTSLSPSKVSCRRAVMGEWPSGDRWNFYWVVVLMVERVAVNHYVGGSSPSFPANAFIAG